MSGVGVAAGVRSGISTVVAGCLTAALTGCALWGDSPDPDTPDREEPGPTLAAGPPPGGWQDVRSPTGLVYSVPPDWEVGDPFGAPAPGDTDVPQDPGSDWGSGYVTTANAIADRGYCAASGLSFRTLSGISTLLPGDAREQAESASRAMADSIDRRFTRNGADVPVPEARSIGVSGVPAWYVSLRGAVRPPRDSCTPPTIRFDTIAVSTRATDGSPASIVFVLMSDEDEPGVQPEATIDAVVASLRYDNSV
ncbi:hypothetical protein H483_0113105 [Dietzia sp. UCD-THP]|uniref:hypothetical protein n=1 Tax=Dietzia sp. UCD-THP TaxID=1292020 RepID=UPI00035E220F|nr:hypothetical protein [Dietzia sp. UCD-THP]EYT61083.1 hypothetical protein H483_0113105 [Dietzia sp. UCD-THP]